MSRTDRSSEAGFSLIETVAALGILALAALPLMQTATNAARGSRFLEDRMLARIVAENVLAFELVRLDLQDAGERTGLSGQMGRSFEWTLETGPAIPGEVQMLNVDVRRAGEEQILASLGAIRAVLPLQETTPGLDETPGGGTAP